MGASIYKELISSIIEKPIYTIDLWLKSITYKPPINNQIDITNNNPATYMYKIYFLNKIVSIGKLVKI